MLILSLILLIFPTCYVSWWLLDRKEKEEFHCRARRAFRP